MTIREYLAACTWKREDVARFLDASQESWARFDPELGYRLNNIVMRDGVGGCYTISSYMKNGARRMIQYADLPCRMNTYGNSFTQCHQVSDGETWQEILAAHLGEPMRNFGVGGYGVYQAFRRMRRVEQTADGTPYVVLNIYDDDHVRNLDMSRWFRLAKFRQALGEDSGVMFHGNPWVHVRWDRAAGRFVERSNAFSTPESLYRLCDADFVYETFAGDEVVQLECMRQGATIEDVSSLEELGRALNVAADLRGTGARKEADRLFMEYALRSTMFTLDLVHEFLQKRGKKLMVLLSYGPGKVAKALNGVPRIDRMLLDYLQRNNMRFVDGLARHAEDAKAFRVGAQEYCKRYFIGHYNPTGNQFFAFAVKDDFVDWLEPKPRTYGERGATFTGAAGKLA